MTALILQARLDSNRLPRKALLPLGERPLIFRVMEAFGSFPVEKKILACPEDSAPSFAPLAEEAGFILVPGPKEDVLARFCLAVRSSGAERIVRATGDNPFVFVDAARVLSLEAEDLAADYASYKGLPRGSGVEAVSSEALLRAGREASDPYEREHVCPYLYNHGELFRLHMPEAPLCWHNPKLSVTVDTQDDYERAVALYARLRELPLEERYCGKTVIACVKRLLAEAKAR